MARRATKTYYMFGLQRSGTNYLEQLISSNFADAKKGNMANIVWKHSIDVPEHFYPAKHTPIIIYKNHLTWVESLLFRNQEDFFRKQTTYTPSENDVESIAKTYRHWYDTWIRNYETSSLVIRYEDILIEEKRNLFLENVKDEFKFVKNPGDWKNISAGKVSHSKNYTDDMREYYLEGKPSRLTQDQIDKIGEIINNN